jgi:hypothetical protein
LAGSAGREQAWAPAIRDQLELHAAARGRFAANTADRESWERLHVSALVLVIAIDQVLTFERRVRRVTRDAELAKERERFDRKAPDAEMLRHLVAHLDAYATGEGERQTGKRHPALQDDLPSPLIYWSDSSPTELDLGDKHMNLGAAAEAAIELAEVVERVREGGLARAEREANEAMERRFRRFSPPPSG